MVASHRANPADMPAAGRQPAGVFALALAATILLAAPLARAQTAGSVVQGGTADSSQQQTQQQQTQQQQQQQQAQDQAQRIEESGKQQNQNGARILSNAVVGRVQGLLTGGGPLGGMRGPPGGGRLPGGGRPPGGGPAAPGGETRQNGSSGGDVAADAGLGFWLSGDYTRLRDEQPDEGFLSRVRTGLAGGDFRVGERLVLGLGGAYDHSRTEYRDTIASRISDGLTGLAYAAFVLDDTFALAAQLAYSRVENDSKQDESGTTVTGGFASQRYLAGAQLLATRYSGDWLFTGTAGFTWSKEAFHDYVDSEGATVAPDATRVGLARLGGEVSHDFDGFAPFLGLNYDYDIQAGDRQDSVGHASDPNGIEVQAGLRLTTESAWSGGIAVTRSFDRGYEDSYGASVDLRYSF